MKNILSFLKTKKNNLAFRINCLYTKYEANNVFVEFDPNWFKGKRVAIVGGADSVLVEPMGEYIDNFDVVVRVNNGVSTIASQKKYVGQRTDFLFHSFFDRPGDQGSSPLTFNLWKQYKVGIIIFARNFNINPYELNNFRESLKQNTIKYPISQIPLKEYSTEKKALNTFSPTSGFTAINTVLSCKPKEVYLTGITFFKTPHNTAYRNINLSDQPESLKIKKDHCSDLEYQYVKKLFRQHTSIINPDKTLKQIFETN